MKFESELAESVFRSKYLLEGETEPDQAVNRVVNSVSKVYPELKEEAYNYINNQWFIPAGGIWRAAGNPNKNVSHINCTNLGHVDDNLESIFDSIYQWGKFAAFGQGEGIDISRLRPRGAKVHNSSRSSTGAVSFMYLFDATLKIIAQQGRRGASLISMIDHHPDILEFITIKDKPESDKSRIDTANISVQATDEFMKAVKEDKEWVLHYENKYEKIEKTVRARDIFDKMCEIAWKRGDPGLQFIDTWRKYSNSDPLGYPLEASNACQPAWAKLLTPTGYKNLSDLNIGDIIWSTEGWTTIVNKWSTGVKKVYEYKTKNGACFYGTNDHRIVENGVKVKVNDADYIDVFINCDTTYTSTITKPSPIISRTLLREEEVFELTVNNASHTYWTDGCNVSNCGEVPGDKHNTCLLSHINLSKYKEYGHDGFIKLIKFGIKFLNACKVNEIEEGRVPIDAQLEKLKNIPRIGLGDTGFADYLLDKGIPYGSEESIKEREYIGKTMAKYAYETGYELAKKYGSYNFYDKQKIKSSAYIQRLLNEGLISDETLDYQFNVQYLSLAPVGSGSLVSNCGGSGIEPLYSKYMVRRERSTSSDWKEWFTFNPYVERYLKNNGLEVTKENADNLKSDIWVMSYDVDPKAKVKLVSEAQKWIDSSISVTFNLPEEATIEDVKDIYMSAWENELKGVTVYREGSLTGVLITEHNYNKQLQDKKKAEKKGHDDDYVPRPESLPCDIHHMKYKDQKLLILVGLKDDKPYEVFVTPNNDNEIDTEAYKQGYIVKKKAGHYDLIIQNGVAKTMINNIGKVFDSTYGTLSRMVSMSLRHNVPINFIVDQLNKDSGFIAFEKCLSRVLKKYIKDGLVSRKVCPECGSEIIYKDGCQSCSNSSCAWSKCD